MSDKAVCANCRYWHDKDIWRGGQCRIGRPAMRGKPLDNIGALASFGQDDAMWPVVRATDFCGEFEKRGEPS